MGFLSPPDLVFEERAPHERGFAETFRRHILPQLGELERARWATLVAMVGIVLMCGGFVWFSIEMQWSLAAKLGAAAAFGLPWIPAGLFWAREERALLGALCGHFPGLRCTVKTQLPEARLQPYRAASLLPPPESPALFAVFAKFQEVIEIEEELTCRHRGIAVWLGEGSITEKQGDKESRLFYGTLLELRLPPGPPGRLVAPDALPADAAPGTRALATPALREALERLAELLGSAAMQADIVDDTLYAAMPQGGRARPLSVGGISQSAYRCEPMLRATLAQIAQLYAVADALADACGAPPAEPVLAPAAAPV